MGVAGPRASNRLPAGSGAAGPAAAFSRERAIMTAARVLHDLGVRTGVDDVKSLAAILIQADRFGSSIAQALRVQSDAMRTRRKQIAEEKAAKTAVQLLFPLILFIFPVPARIAVAILGLPVLRTQCQRYAIAQVRAILADPHRVAVVRGEPTLNQVA